MCEVAWSSGPGAVFMIKALDPACMKRIPTVLRRLLYLVVALLCEAFLLYIDEGKYTFDLASLHAEEWCFSALSVLCFFGGQAMVSRSLGHKSIYYLPLIVLVGIVIGCVGFLCCCIPFAAIWSLIF